jgi:hypothetical protein
MVTGLVGGFKIVFSTSIILILIMASITLYTAWESPALIHRHALSNTPYAVVSGVNVTAGGVVIRITIVDRGGLAFKPSGGWVEVVETGQVANITVDDNALTAVVPLTPEWATLSSVGVKGIVSGVVNNSEAYIAFFDVEHVHVVNSINITGVGYANCTLTVTLSVSTVAPVTIGPITNASMFTLTTPGYFIFVLDGSVGGVTSLPAGVHNVTITINLNDAPGRVYYCNYPQGFSAFRLIMPVRVILHYPGFNTTNYLTLIGDARVSGG